MQRLVPLVVPQQGSCRTWLPELELENLMEALAMSSASVLDESAARFGARTNKLARSLFWLCPLQQI